LTRLVFDIETNGLLDTITTIHCLVTLDVDSGHLESYGPNDIDAGVKQLQDSDELIGHNVIKFDLPAITKLFPWFTPRGKVTDTLVLSRLIYSDIKSEKQDGLRLATGQITKDAYGSHSLDAWGQRVGLHKLKYEGGWEEWTPEMQVYCEHDARVTLALWKFLKPWDYSQVSVDLEHSVAKLCAKIEDNGWPFDVKGAVELYARLAQRRDELKVELQGLFDPWEEVDRVVTYKRPNKKLGIQAGDTRTYMKTVVFNPGSRQHIEKCLIAKYGWKPEVYTPTGQAKIDEDVLGKLEYPEAKKLGEFFLVEKRIGQLAEGDQAWIKLERKGKVHGSYNTNGAVTGRATHSNPNISQVPSVQAEFGRECRALFYTPRGWKTVGADYSGLELRCLAHYMATFDNGTYAREVVDGDVHTANQKAAGLPTRANAKTFIYAFLYGAGDEKIGKIVGKGSREGRELKKRFLQATPALASLKKAVSNAASRGYLKGLDGRILPIRSSHAALNTLLQSAGAVLCKGWITGIDEALKASGLKHGWDGDYAFLGWIHDEIQIAVKEGYEEQVGKTCLRVAEETGHRFSFKCPLASEYKIGSNWAETH